MQTFTTMMTWLDQFTIIFATIAAVFTVWNFFSNKSNNKKQNQDIKIKLTCNGEDLILEQTVKRLHCSRSEVSGLLGAAFQGEKRFDIPFFASKTFSQRLEQVQGNKENILTIDIDDKEQFDKFKSKN